MPGNSQSSSGIYTVQGAGSDIGGTSDQFQYCYRSISGDVDIRVRVAAMQDTSAGSKFGLMIRDSMNANARNVFVLLSAEQQVALQWRTKAGRTTGKVTGATVATPAWIRLVRQGNTFRGYRSIDGSTWTQIASTNFRMASNIYVGLAVTSHNLYQPATGTFSGLAMGNSAPLVPAPWTAKDIGSPAIAGAATESGGTFTVSGAGTDIFNSSDQFQFVYQPVSGDTQIVARVAGLQAANSWSKAGLMIRADLTGSAANAGAFATASGSWVAQERLAAGGATFQAAGSPGAPPGWVKVVREGDVLSAFESPDGSTWTLVDTDTIPMPSTVYVGLAVTSHASTAVATATFTNVAVSVPDSTNNPPTVSITAPASGASYTAPASITISATAADSDGSVARVDFYQGSTLIGSDTSSPYSFAWGDVAAGTYSVTAVATDNVGDTTTSMPVSVTVNSSNKPPTVSISIPSSASGYTAPANITISATAADSDGTVARVDFYQGSTLIGFDTSSPYSVAWSNIAAGTYSLTAVATDNAGDTATSMPVSVTVDSANKPPTVSITAPASGATYTAPASMTISATAADTDGSVTRVDFYQGSTLLGSDTTSPYTFSWSNVAAGTYTLTAVARDNAGDTTTSTAVSVTVNPANKPPTVAISSPGPGASFTAPASIAISAGASDTDGVVKRVDFYAGGQLVGSSTAAPFTATWSNVQPGTYSLTAKATDDKDATTTSAAVSVSVAAAAPPPPPPTPTTIVFVPGADYATDATSVTVELRPAGAAATSTPVATRNLGKPAVAGGEISVDISTLVNPLPAGSYYAIIVTTGPGGSTPSAPSGTFSK